MTFAQKLAISKIALALSAIFLLAIVAKTSAFVSYHYCHGSSHNAHGAYCETVYQDEYSALR